MTSSTMAMPVEQNARLLRWGIVADAVLCGVTGVVSIVDAPWLATHLGVGTTPILAFGVILLVVVAYEIWLLRQNPLPLRQVVLLPLVNIVWVLASAVVLIGGLLPLTTTGFWIELVTALVVADIAIVQLVGLRRAQNR